MPTSRPIAPANSHPARNEKNFNDTPTTSLMTYVVLGSRRIFIIPENVTINDITTASTVYAIDLPPLSSALDSARTRRILRVASAFLGRAAHSPCFAEHPDQRRGPFKILGPAGCTQRVVELSRYAAEA